MNTLIVYECPCTDSNSSNCPYWRYGWCEMEMVGDGNPAEECDDFAYYAEEEN